MPIRFSTEAANADKLNDGKPDGAPDEMAEAASVDGKSRGKDDNKPERQRESNETRPGKDINAAGFVRDKDADKP
jgi:hypothetical protein